jgi:hypothetical protein
MPLTLIVRRDHLKAALLFAANGDIRRYLNCVCIEVYPDHHRLLATDGCVAAIIKGKGGDSSVPVRSQYILGREHFESIKAHKGLPSVAITLDEDLASITDTGSVRKFAVVEKRFPKVYPNLPRAPSGNPAAYNPELLMRFAKAAKMLGSNRPGTGYQIAYNGNGPALITLPISPEFVGCVMPFRGGIGAEMPKWVDWRETEISEADDAPEWLKARAETISERIAEE